jgi:hypothetical protein
MSYSRWGGRGRGYWYTFWLSPDGYPENRDTAVFEVCTVAHFTANELRGDMDGCMERAHRMDPDGDIDELRVYAREFLADVDARYPPWKDSENTDEE